MSRQDDIIESEEGFTAITPLGQEIGTYETEEEAEEAEAEVGRGDQQLNRGPEKSETVKLDRIEKRKRGTYVVLSEAGREMGTYKTRAAAEDRLAQIERFKEDAKWSTAYINDLPDSSFLYVGPGGEKVEGKTTPRSLRKFPIKGPDGKVDLPHLRNAIARIPQSDLPAAKKKSLQERARLMLEERNEGRADSVRRFDVCVPIHTDAKRTDGIRAKIDESTGFLKAEVSLTRTGVFKYQDGRGNTWGEYRDAREVFDEESMRSFEQVPVTDNHPQGFVTTDNYQTLAKGSVGSIRRQGDTLMGTLLIMDAELIRKIEDGKEEVSCGYEVHAKPRRGVHDGQEYSYVQTRIRGNHLAVVQAGRAGPSCRINLDAGDAALIGDEQMKTIEIEGTQHEVPSQVADEIEALRADMSKSKDMFKKKKTFTEEEEEDDSKSKDMSMKGKKKADEADARYDMLKAEFDSFRADEQRRIDERAGVLASAKEVAPKFDTAGKTNAEIRVAVIESIQPEVAAKLDGKSEDYILACYDAALQLHADRIANDPREAIGRGFAPEQGEARRDSTAAAIARAHLKMVEG